MEYDRYAKHDSCPKFNCRKKCECGFSFYNIPASLGDDSPESEAAPKNGDYCSAITRYENGGAIYLWSKDGVPIKLSDGSQTGIFVPHLDVDEEAQTVILSWTNNVGRDNPDPTNIRGEKGEKGDQGEKGDPGDAIAIKGEKPTPDDLPTDPEDGDAWLVQGDLYVWTGTDWQNVGRVQGPQGEVGPHYEPHITEDPDNDEVILSWTNTGSLPNPDPVNIKGHEGSNANAKVLFSRVPLSSVVGGSTVLSISNLDSADQGDISAPETEIYDSAGTVGVVVSFDTEEDTMVVRTITISPVERQGVRLGTVNTPADLPTTIEAATAIGWNDIIEGDFAYVREDPSHDNLMAEYYIAQILGNEDVMWAYSHSLNNGDYQLAASAAEMSGMILTGGFIDGTWGSPIDPDTLQEASNTIEGYILTQGSIGNTFGQSISPDTYQLSNTSEMEGKILIGGVDNEFGTPLDIDTYQLANTASMEGKILVGGVNNAFGTPLDITTYQVANDSTMEGMLLVGGESNLFGTPIDPETLRVEDFTNAEIDGFWSDQAWGTSI